MKTLQLRPVVFVAHLRLLSKYVLKREIRRGYFQV